MHISPQELNTIEKTWHLRRRFVFSSSKPGQLSEILLQRSEHDTLSHYNTFSKALTAAYLHYTLTIKEDLNTKSAFFNSRKGLVHRCLYRTLQFLPNMKAKNKQVDDYIADMQKLKQALSMSEADFAADIVDVKYLSNTLSCTLLLSPHTPIYFLSLGGLLHQGPMNIYEDSIEHVSLRFQKKTTLAAKNPELALNYTTQKGRSLYFNHHYTMVAGEAFYGDQSLRAFFSIQAAIVAAQAIVQEGTCQWHKADGTLTVFDLKEDVGSIVVKPNTDAVDYAQSLPDLLPDELTR
jgi:hypothetical protein